MTRLAIFPWVVTNLNFLILNSLPPYPLVVIQTSPHDSPVRQVFLFSVWIHFIVITSVLETQSFHAIFNSLHYLILQIQFGAKFHPANLRFELPLTPSLPFYFQFSHFSSGPLATQMGGCKNLPMCYPTSK